MARNKQRAPKAPVANPEDGGAGPGDPLAQEAWTRWKQSGTHLKDTLADAKENYDFLAGVQWTDEELATLKVKQRPIIVFNRTMATLSAVSGYEINNRQDVAYLPREPDDTGAAEVDTAASKYFREECNAEDQESEQFRDMLTSGYGWTEHIMNYDDNPEGMYEVRRVDMMEMRYDPSAMSPNLTDRGWDIRGKWWDKERAQRKWPKADFTTPVPAFYDLDNLDMQPPIDRLAAAFYKSPGTGEMLDVRKGKVGILEYTWFEMEPFYTVVNPTTGSLEDVSPSTHDKFQERLEERGMPRARSVKRERRKFKRAFIHANEVIEKGDAPCPDQFHYQCITGYRNRNKNTWFGMVSLMKDPQRWANKWLSQFLFQLNTNVSTGIWYEKGAFERPGEVEQKIAKPGFALGIEPGYFEKVRKEEPAQLPNDAFNLMTYAVSSIRDATGANLEILGQQSNDQSGVTEAHRKQSAMNVLAPLFSAQRHYRKISGRIALHYIRTYLSDGRWIRLVGQGNAKYVQLAKRGDAAEYDIIVDESPSSPNQKELVFGVLSMILPQLLKLGVPVPPEIVDYVPGLPAQLGEKWKQLIQQKASQPAPPDPKTAVAQQKLQLEAQKMQQEAASSANQDRLDQERLNFDKMKLMFERWMEEREDARQQQKFAIERAKIDNQDKQHLASLAHDTITQHHDHAHDKEIAAADRQFQQAEAAADRDHASAEGAEERKHASQEGAADRKAAARKPKGAH